MFGFCMFFSFDSSVYVGHKLCDCMFYLFFCIFSFVDILSIGFTFCDSNIEYLPYITSLDHQCEYMTCVTDISLLFEILQIKIYKKQNEITIHFTR